MEVHLPAFIGNFKLLFHVASLLCRPKQDVVFEDKRQRKLKMGVDATEREGLTFLRTVDAKSIVGEATVIAMVVLDGDIVPTSK